MPDTQATSNASARDDQSVGVVENQAANSATAPASPLRAPAALTALQGLDFTVDNAAVCGPDGCL